MKIGIYNPAVGIRKSGGTETFLREIMKRLQEKHDIILFIGKGELLDEIRQMDIKVVQIPFIEKNSKLSKNLQKLNIGPIAFEIESISMYLKARNVLKDILKKEKLDVLSTHYYLDNLLLSRFCKKLNIPVIFRFPGIKYGSIRWKIMAKYAKSALYIANSMSTAKRVKKWLGIDVDGVVYPGVDIHKFKPDVEPIIKNDSDSFKILFVGRLEHGKGIPILLRATKELIRRGCKVKTYIVGDGMLENEIRQQIKGLKLEKYVKMVGAVSHNELCRYYVSCDVFCLPSLHEGFPIVNLEAMACGIPVISTKMDAILEQIIDEKEGLLFRKGDYKDLANKIEYLYYNEDVRKKLGKNARKKVIKKFSWEKSVKEMEVLYERATES